MPVVIFLKKTHCPRAVEHGLNCILCSNTCTVHRSLKSCACRLASARTGGAWPDSYVTPTSVVYALVTYVSKFDFACVVYDMQGDGEI